MNELNHKALYFCHTHPNLFLQKKCDSCKRGMCHTCIHNNKNYCSDCLTINKRFSSGYEAKKQIITCLVFAAIITGIAVLIFVQKLSNLPDYPLIKNSIITFFIALSIANAYYLFNKTDILSSVNKVPFIGFKLSLAVLALVTASGLPILYMLYKSVLLLKSDYFKQA
ncbi:MAG: hypothetical protein AB8B52_05985 [Winogradskyella sp.]|uniref:hypothetical protein n=1 Tax=Winogradskyella sp. TaxID=1883156 RepID=UPI00385EF4EB